MNTGYCDYLPKTDNSTEMWQIFNVKNGSWYFWYAIILDEDGKLNLYPSTKYQGKFDLQSPATTAQRHRLFRLLFRKEFLFEP